MYPRLGTSALQHGKVLSGKVFRPIYLFKSGGLKQRTVTWGRRGREKGYEPLIYLQPPAP